jgi:hypothetical protein
MKIGILTYHAAYNFGANLQALSTFNYLKKQGNVPIMIDFSPIELEKAFDKLVPFEQANMHKLFLQKHFVLSNRCRNSQEVAREIIINNIEAIIIGSDAVVQHYSFLSRIKIIPSWKKLVIIRIDPIHYETNFPNPFWGDFLNYLDKRISVAFMSVSCQNTDYMMSTRSERRQINTMISKFSYISVRDKRTQDLFMHFSKGRYLPKITPDPVFAFNDNVINMPTKTEIRDKFKLPEKYILLSFNSSKTVSKPWVSTFESLAIQSGYQCVAFAMPEGIKFDNNLSIRVDIPLDPIDWYSIIKFSSAYVGEKMHPIIVALHNSVPFFSFDHYGILKLKLFLNQKASKTFQLLETAGFNDLRISIAKRFHFKAPTPQYVLEKIISFNKENCALFSNQMRDEYKTMMNELLNALN